MERRCCSQCGTRRDMRLTNSKLEQQHFASSSGAAGRNRKVAQEHPHDHHRAAAHVTISHTHGSHMLMQLFILCAKKKSASSHGKAI